MKITIWHNCVVVTELNLDAPGPNMGIDPWNNLIGTGTEMIHEAPVGYWDGLNVKVN